MCRMSLYLLAAALAAASAAMQHNCIHDRIQKRISIGKERPAVDGARRTALNPDAVGNLRIVYILDNLYDSTKYCTAVDEVRPSYTSDTGTVTCTADDILTDARRDLLVQTILPSVASILSNALSVDRRTTPISVPQGACFASVGVPASATSPGISNADIVILVTSTPTAGSVVAFAGFCDLDVFGRPIIGFVNYGTQNLEADGIDTLVRVGVHELMHALGFSSEYFTNLLPFGTIINETRRGGPVTVFTAPLVVTKAQEYFNCSTLTGPELENEGGPGTAFSHWKRRSQFDDIMAGVIGPSLISAITLAVFEASGRYVANFSAVEALRWGKNGGCGFFGSRCDTADGGLGREFCLDGDILCTYDRKAIGRCAITTFSSDLPSYEQYFSDPRRGGEVSLMSYCPIVSEFADQLCNEVTGGTNNTILGETFGPGGRCIETSPRMSTATSSITFDFPRRCMIVTCEHVANSANIQVLIMLGSSQVACPVNMPNAVVDLTPYGYSGTLTCPDPSEVCDTVSSIAIETASPSAAPVTAASTDAPSATNTSSPITILDPTRRSEAAPWPIVAAVLTLAIVSMML